MRMMIPPSFVRFQIWGCTTIHKTIADPGVGSGRATATIAGRFTIDLFLACLSTESFVEKLSGPLLQPKLHTVQVTILIHAAHSHSSHACHNIMALLCSFPQVYTTPTPSSLCCPNTTSTPLPCCPHTLATRSHTAATLLQHHPCAAKMLEKINTIMSVSCVSKTQIW